MKIGWRHCRAMFDASTVLYHLLLHARTLMTALTHARVHALTHVCRYQTVFYDSLTGGQVSL